jgi:Nitroreductase family
LKGEKRESGELYFRRAPSLVSYWLHGKLVFHNYATGQVASAAPIVCEVLNFFDRWRTSASLAKHLNQFTSRSIQKAVAGLVRTTFLERSDNRNDRGPELHSAWTNWNPAAGFFHFSRRDTPYDSDLERADRAVRILARRVPLPQLAKTYPRAPKTPLPNSKSGNALAKIFLERRTWRQFSREPVSLAHLGPLLDLTFGVREWISIKGVGKFPLKTSPSAGAMHPIEAYVVAQRVNALTPGIYQYDSERHELALLRRGASVRETAKFLAG